MTQMIVGLGRGDRLVGVTRFCDAPGVAVVMDAKPQIERILAARPDLVVAGQYASVTPATEALSAMGLDVLSLPLDSLDDARRALRALGAHLDARPAAEALVQTLDAALARARARAASRPGGKEPAVLLVFDAGDGYVYTTGGGDHLAELLSAVGARNVAAGGPLTTRLPLEQLETSRPDLIIHAAPDPQFPDDAAALAWWRAVMPDLPAVHAGRVHVWPDASLATHGPGLARAVDRLSALVEAAAAQPRAAATPTAPR
ncbi:MAG: ABC transporter substrate-binding protein [Deltaproteobacteria bacterium]|nr:ABC transporter substrate-binding protein [Deltaproteobacteria bacterium]